MCNNIIEESKGSIDKNILKSCSYCGGICNPEDTLCYSCIKSYRRYGGSLLDTVNTSHENIYKAKKPESYYQKNNYCGEFLEISQSNYPRHRNYSGKKVNQGEKKEKDYISQQSTIQSNLRRRRNIRRIINSNINNKSRSNSKHLTLTFNYDEFDYMSASKLFDLFLKRLKYHFIKDGRYYLVKDPLTGKDKKICNVGYFKVVELQPVSRRIHFHVLLFGCDRFPVWDYIKFDGQYFQDWYSKDGKEQVKDKLIEFQNYCMDIYGCEYTGDVEKISHFGMSSIWGLGNIKLQNCFKIENLGSYFAKYITKDIPIEKNLRIYSCSQDLERPIEIIYPHWDLLHLQKYDVDFQKSIYLDTLSYYQNFKKLDNRCINIIFCKLRC